MAFTVVGGPADGIELAYAPGVFRWVDPLRRRGYAKPGPGRELYRRFGARWVFQGVEAWACGCCGAIVVLRLDQCPLCGRNRKGGQDGEG